MGAVPSPTTVRLASRPITADVFCGCETISRGSGISTTAFNRVASASSAHSAWSHCQDGSGLHILMRPTPAEACPMVDQQKKEMGWPLAQVKWFIQAMDPAGPNQGLRSYKPIQRARSTPSKLEKVSRTQLCSS